MIKICTTSMIQSTHDSIYKFLDGLGVWCCEDCNVYHVHEELTKMCCGEFDDVYVCNTCRGKD